MYSYISNPETGRKVSIYGKIGQKVIRNYINVMNGGACSEGSKQKLDKIIANKETCWGCKQGQANQQAHMDPGGCLYYQSDDDLDTSPEKTNLKESSSPKETCWGCKRDEGNQEAHEGPGGCQYLSDSDDITNNT